MSPSSSTTGRDSEAGPSYTQLHSLEPEVIIIGAGIAGASLAFALQNSGRQVLLLERDLSEPDRIVGELLQPGGVAALQTLGMGDCLDGIDAVGVEGYCVVSGERMVGIPYPSLEAFVGEGKGEDRTEASVSVEKGWRLDSQSGKKEGRSFHHGRLISALRDKCRSHAPGLVVLEATVKELLFCPHTDHVLGVAASFKSKAADGATTTTTTTRKIYAPLTIIADGCFSKFRTQKGARVPVPQTRSHFVGLILKDTEMPMPRHGTVCLTPNGPVLLYQIADKAHETRMLVDVKGKLPSLADGSLKEHIIDAYLPHLPSSTHPSILAALDASRLRTMPNSFLPPSMQGLSTSLKGCIMIGDAWNMRHPLTGGGMTVAFNDAVLLTEYLRPDEKLPAGRAGLENWDEIAGRLREWFWRRKRLAGVVNILSMALYDLFGGAEDSNLEVLREGCFRYFELGGECVAGPVGLLSALTPKPILLFYHFFAVALYSIYILLTVGPPPRSGEKPHKPTLLDMPGLVITSGRVFYAACVVLLPVIWSEIKI
ncbi:squalene monooxygenase, partial [Tremellales sp. Uapishka_1]